MERKITKKLLEWRKQEEQNALNLVWGQAGRQDLQRSYLWQGVLLRTLSISVWKIRLKSPPSLSVI
ncbi:Hypothetical protein DEACI_4227 [Acididesulfobacillus acetoxydans]|uniref:Uncharacterized protein n=1 Tax=Acididesulfobacillus acetoxydans TaxID=1561005 RepID=A0A8S0WRN0_9FIRM|nr:Hypothetical protein DEACI_4227 [Acididesulfobacillus acetoxydans]CEJ06499.1 Hypothetical protein DEACI_0947 [Acididesulfobacillus acetoxydans]